MGLCKRTMVEGPPSIHLVKDNVQSRKIVVANLLSNGMWGCNYHAISIYSHMNICSPAATQPAPTICKYSMPQ